MIDQENVRKIAHLSRLNLTDDEVERQCGQLNQIIDMMNLLNDIDTEGVEPLNHVTVIANVMRDDVVNESMDLDKLFQNAPAVEDRMFLVSRIV